MMENTAHNIKENRLIIFASSLSHKVVVEIRGDRVIWI